ncbi:MAG: YraN family protein [Parcubacteria group bacterium]|nr:YraN family protein [Parcubacteria group bacterium]
MHPAHQVGKLGEEIARDFLISRGYSFVAANHRTRWGELDLIMCEGGQTVFVEVKTRRLGNPVAPNNELSDHKLGRLEAAADMYCQKNGIEDWRIEAVAVTLDERSGQARVRLIEC